VWGELSPTRFLVIKGGDAKQNSTFTVGSAALSEGSYHIGFSDF
jgi:hypothetical protein